MERISWEYHSKEGLKIADDAELQNRMEDLKVSIDTLDTSIGNLQTVIEYMSSRYITPEISALGVIGRSDAVSLEAVKFINIDKQGITEEGAYDISIKNLAFDGTYFYTVYANTLTLIRWEKDSTITEEIATNASYGDIYCMAYSPDDGKIWAKKQDVDELKIYPIDPNDGTIGTALDISWDSGQGFTLGKIYSITYDPIEGSLLALIRNDVDYHAIARVNTSTGIALGIQFVDANYMPLGVGPMVSHRNVYWIFRRGVIVGGERHVHGWARRGIGYPVYSCPMPSFGGPSPVSPLGMVADSQDEVGFYTCNLNKIWYFAPTPSLNIDDAGGSVTVDATSLPLPTGAATSALQTTMLTALQKIDDLQNALAAIATDQLRVDIISDAAGLATTANQTTMITALQLIDDLRNALAAVATDQLRIDIISDSAGLATSVHQTTMITALQLIDDLRTALATVASDQLRTDVISSALPAGAATAAHQTTMITALQLIDDLQGALGSIDTDVLISRIEEANSIVGGNTAMSDAQAEVVAARADRKGLLIQNVDTADTVWVGPTGVAVGTGIELLPKQSMVLNHYTGSTASIFGICDAGKTANIRYLEAF